MTMLENEPAAEMTAPATDSRRVRQPMSMLRATVIAASLSLLVGVGHFVYSQSQPGVYQAEARLLLLGDNDLYMPMIEAGATTRPVGLMSDDARWKLVQSAALSDIVTRFKLANDPDYGASLPWSSLLSGLSVRETHSAEERSQVALQDAITLDYNDARHVLSIKVRDPQPERATALANALANAYRDAEQDDQRNRHGSAVARLEADVNALDEKLANMRSQTGRRVADENLPDDERQVFEEKEQARIDVLMASIAAQEKMADQMRMRLQEAKTRRTLDLLPPRVRILAQATVPEFPLPQNDMRSAVYLSILSFLLMQLGLFAMRLLRASRRKRDTSAALPALPQSMCMAPIVADEGRSESTPDEDGQGDVMMQRRQRPDADIAPERIADLLRRPHYKRLVLISEDGDWQDTILDVSLRLMRDGKRIAVMELANRNSWADEAEGDAIGMDAEEDLAARRYGISDLVDGDADCLSIIEMDETGQCAVVGPGSRELQSADFFSADFHALLMALERSFDYVLIDVGPYYDDEYALKSLGLSEESLACIYAGEADTALAEQVKAVMRHFGYQECLVIPTDLLPQRVLRPDLILTEAAE